MTPALMGHAGIAYNPSLHENTIIDPFGEYEKTTKPANKQETNPAEFVVVSPNPANPATTIRYLINDASIVKLSVYSINGQKVATLIDNYMSAGTHTTKFDGSRLATGIYLYQFESNTMLKRGKILLVK